MLMWTGFADAQEVNQMRTWNDQTGKFEVEALFESVYEGEVTLIRKDGNEIKVPLQRLSEKDQAFIERMLNPPEPAPEPEPEPTRVNPTTPDAESTETVPGELEPKMKANPNLLGGLGSLLILIGFVLLAWSTIWWLIVTFRESALWGLGCIFVPFVGLVFLCQFWEKAKGAFFIHLLSLVLIIGGGFALIKNPLFEVIDEVRKEQAAERENSEDALFYDE